MFLWFRTVITDTYMKNTSARQIYVHLRIRTVTTNATIAICKQNGQNTRFRKCLPVFLSVVTAVTDSKTLVWRHCLDELNRILDSATLPSTPNTNLAIPPQLAADIGVTIGTCPLPKSSGTPNREAESHRNVEGYLELGGGVDG